MPEKIYTIPVNDAWQNESCLCPFCQLLKEIEDRQVDYYLSPAMMEVDVREQSNENGFCQKHLRQLYAAEKNKLSLGLVLDSRVELLHRKVQKASSKALSALKQSPGFFKGRNFYAPCKELVQLLNENIGQNCLICQHIRETLPHYLEVIVWMYINSESFRSLFLQKKLCFVHSSLLLDFVLEKSSQKDAKKILPVLIEALERELATLQEDLHWFTLKFDYRYQNEDWKNSKDAIPRSIDYLKGKV